MHAGACKQNSQFKNTLSRVILIQVLLHLPSTSLKSTLKVNLDGALGIKGWSGERLAAVLED